MTTTPDPVSEKHVEAAREILDYLRGPPAFVPTDVWLDSVAATLARHFPAPDSAGERELREAIADLEQIVCVKEPDEGVVLLSNDGPTHTEIIDGKPCQAYDHEYFSPLGDALIALHKKLNAALPARELQIENAGLRNECATKSEALIEIRRCLLPATFGIPPEEVTRLQKLADAAIAGKPADTALRAAAEDETAKRWIDSPEAASFKAAVERGEVGHWGRFDAGEVWCSWCKSRTRTNKVPPLSITCSGCKRWVRAKPVEPAAKDGG